ncbi:MAG: response regulator [Planctomycetota bacterium]|nr:response regulator [Planctomycetota bacterium]
MDSSVVLIDDEEIVLELQKAVLAEMGIAVRAFRDPVPAWEVIQQGGVKLVITDLEMPKIDGLELLYRIKNLANPPRVIVLTAHDKSMRSMRQASGKTASAQVVKTLSESVYAILGKPYAIDEYKRVVREALGA